MRIRIDRVSNASRDSSTEEGEEFKVVLRKNPGEEYQTKTSNVEGF
jgi:hypothetical protein